MLYLKRKAWIMRVLSK